MPVKTETRSMSRREVRYRLYRLQNDNPVDSKDGLKGHFESQDEFDGWHNFAGTWDVGAEGEWPEGHWIAVPRAMAAAAEWEALLGERAQSLPSVQALVEQGEVALEDEEELQAAGEG